MTMSEIVDMTEKEYRAYDATNYSLLKALEEHPRKAYKMLYDYEPLSTSSLSYGSLLDCLITTPKELNDRFFVCEFVPGDNLEGKAFNLAKEAYPEFEFNHNDVITLIDNNRLWGNVKNQQTKIDKVDKFKFWDHLELLKNNLDKTAIAPETLEKAERARDILKGHEFTHMYFEYPYEIEYQKVILFKYNGVECKILIDMLMWNHMTKKVFILDLKTLFDGAETGFAMNVRKYKYDIQAVFYSEGLEEYIKEHFPDYSTQMPMFMVSSSSWPDNPVMYRLSGNDYRIRLNGEDNRFGNPVKSLSRLLTELKFHKDTGKWDYMYSTYENNGIITTNVH